MLSLIPFSYAWIIKYHLDDVKYILDLGCGDGALFLKLPNKYQVTGVDLSKSDLKKARNTNRYKKVIYQDLRKAKFKKGSFEVVLSSQAIEHLTKKEGLKLIKKMEEIAEKKVIIATTNGFFPFEPFQKTAVGVLDIHKSGWEIDEMKKLGYKVYGQGAGFIHKPGGLLYKLRFLKNFLVVISMILAPINYLFPKISAYIIAVKQIK